ncbi:MAG: SH3 domain-containing protein, partial [Thermodesulfobacteriota bacterium]
MLYFSQTVFKRISVPVALLIFFLSPKLLVSDDRSQSAVILTDRLILRKEPSTRSPSVAVLNQGEHVIVIGQTKGWLNVVSRGRKGFIRNKEEYIRQISEADEGLPEKTPLMALKEKATRLDRRIQLKETRIRELSKQEEDLLEEFDRLDFSINQIERKAAALKSQMGSLEKAIAALNSKSDRLTRQLRTRREYAASRLVALYKLNRLGKLHFIFSARSVGEFLFIEKSLGRILDHDDRLQ